MGKILSVLFLCTFVSGALNSQEVKFALVIGNQDYGTFGKLKNPVNDAKDITASLKKLGFTVDTITDADLSQMEEAVVRLGNRLTGNKQAIGFFFYAGHGIQSGGINYLIPAKSSIASEAFLKTKALAAQAVLDTLQSSGNHLNVIVLDACRDNPFSWGRGGTRGLSVVGQQPPGSLIAYATSAGSVASDGDGRNGLFTQELLRHLETPGLDVAEVFKRTGQGVTKVSGGKQVPAVYNQFFEDAVLAGKAAKAPVQGTNDDPSFGAVTVSKGNLSIYIMASGTVEVLGKKVEVPGGGTLPIKDVPAGIQKIRVTYKDGKVEEKDVMVLAKTQNDVNFTYAGKTAAPAPAASPKGDVIATLMEAGGKEMLDLAIAMEKVSNAGAFKSALEKYIRWEEGFSDRFGEMEDSLDEKGKNFFSEVASGRYQNLLNSYSANYQRFLTSFNRAAGQYSNGPGVPEVLNRAIEADADLGDLFGY